MSQHAKLSASGSDRWTKCPASGYMVNEDEDPRGSVYAAEGTAAHFLCEQCLTRLDARPGDFLGQTIVVYVDEEGHTQSRFSTTATHDADLLDEWGFEVTPEMVDAANLFIQATEDALLTLNPDGVTYVEKKTSPGHPDLGGTLDWGYVSGNRAAIIDLKYGRGIVIDVLDNTQQMIYALGLIALHPEIEFIDTYIVQPRAPHGDGPIRLCSYTAEALVNFYDWLLVCVEAADDPDAERVAGGHCRFCPELAICPATLELAQAAAAVEFAEDHEGEGAIIAEALALSPIVEAWVKAVRKIALAMLMDEAEVPGYKLVNGRGSRSWTADEATVIKAGRMAGLLKAACLSAPKLLSPNQIETAAAKKGGKLSGPAAKAHFKSLWESVAGGPTVAREDDPRRPYRSTAEDDFS